MSTNVVIGCPTCGRLMSFVCDSPKPFGRNSPAIGASSGHTCSHAYSAMRDGTGNQMVVVAVNEPHLTIAEAMARVRMMPLPTEVNNDRHGR